MSKIRILKQNQTNGHLICTLISENQGLEKLRSVSNLRKISGTAYLDFFSVCHLDFFQVYGINLAFFCWWRPRKKSRFAGPEIFPRLKQTLIFQDLDFQKTRCRLKGRISSKFEAFQQPLSRHKIVPIWRYYLKIVFEKKGFEKVNV